jgi:hypothetical protein
MKLGGLIILLFSACQIFSQAVIPVSRTTWSATPTGWTDSYGGQTYTSALACDANSNRGKMTATGHFTQVFFSGVPGVLSFDLQGNGTDAASSLKVEESPDGSTWSTVATISSISGSCVTYTYSLNACSSLYVKWTYTKSIGNLAIDNVSIAGGTCAAAGCPVLTGAILNSCDNGVAGCDEGDAEVMLFNAGAYSITVASLPSNVINYYGSTANFTGGIIDAYTGTFSANAGTTATLNASTGCSGGFIDASTAGTIPAGATFMMVPSTFCATNYNFSNLCSSFSPIYVLYFSTAGWNSGGNLANHQTPSPKPKYITANFGSVNAGCAMEYYTFDADTESIGNGSGVAYPSIISTASATPTSPSAYTSASCTLPIVLPISLLEFKAELIDATTSKIKFVTTNEENVQQYIVSKSTDGFNFTVLDNQVSLNRMEPTDYFSYDRVNSEVNEYVYYRLEEMDLNGVKKNVGTCLIKLKPGKEIKVSQFESFISITLPVAASSIELMSADGKSISYIHGNENELSYQINLDGIAKGFYLLRITDINEKVTIKKIIY